MFVGLLPVHPLVGNDRFNGGNQHAMSISYSIIQAKTINSAKFQHPVGLPCLTK